MEIKQNNMLGEKLFIKTLRNGMKCYIIPKKGYVEKQAMICTNYGSIDNSFSVGGKRMDMPEGIAHFLEHKLFEEEKGNVFEEFSKLGANVNAFTNFTSTAYYFNCIDNFDKAFRALLGFVFRPYFTNENVEKEKGIIAQEITMYDDDPNWKVYFNMLRALYRVHPARHNIAGTVKSVNEITKDMLYDCYNTFYTPDNMAIVCAGDLDCDKVCGMAERLVPAPEKKQDVSRIYGDEPKEIAKAFTTEKMSVSRPLVHIGVKETDFTVEIEDKTAQSQVLLDLLAGESSELYLKLFSEGVIDNTFGVDYSGNQYFGTSIFGGSSGQPQTVYEELKKQIEKIKFIGIDDGDFERLKKKHIGRFIRKFNSINSIAAGQTDCFSKNTNIIAMFEALEKLQKNDLLERLNSHFDFNNMALSIIE